MREIEFRALSNTIKGEKWVYGYPYKVKSLFNDKDFNWYIRNEHIIDKIIDANTLGQYTGLKDKNGKKIFEGDIVHYYDFAFTNGFEVTGTVVYTQDCMFEIEYDDKYIKNHKETRPLVCSEHPIFTSKKIEVIGNIYDNPELLNESEVK